jgi:hypothetical protein
MTQHQSIFQMWECVRAHPFDAIPNLEGFRCCWKYHSWKYCTIFGARVWKKVLGLLLRAIQAGFPITRPLGNNLWRRPGWNNQPISPVSIVDYVFNKMHYYPAANWNLNNDGVSSEDMFGPFLLGCSYTTKLLLVNNGQHQIWPIPFLESIRVFELNYLWILNAPIAFQITPTLDPWHIVHAVGRDSSI